MRIPELMLLFLKLKRLESRRDIGSVTTHFNLLIDGAQLSLGTEEERVSSRQTKGAIDAEFLRCGPVIIAENWKRHRQFGGKLFRFFEIITNDDEHVDLEFQDGIDAVTQRLALSRSAWSESLGDPCDDQTFTATHSISQGVLLAV